MLQRNGGHVSEPVVIPGSDIRGACDCHVHVIGPHGRYPLTAVRSYTPAHATTDDLIDMMRHTGVDRAVVVQPSIYGVDNRCTLDALPILQQAGLQARAVAVLAADTNVTELDRLHAIGVRGLRVNLQSHAGAALDQALNEVRGAVQLCLRHGWHLQMFVDRQTVMALKSEIMGLAVPVVFDHFAGLSLQGVDDKASQAVLELLSSGQVWIKLSGTYRVADNPYDERFAQLAQTLAQINPDKLVWASDWPHTPKHQGVPVADPPVQPYRTVDTKRLRLMVNDWFDAELARRVLVDNPARLYAFD